MRIDHSARALGASFALVLSLLLHVPAAVDAEDGAISPERLRELEGRFRAVAESTRPASVAVIGLVGMGSGVVIDRTGLVLTNAHVAVAARYAAIVFPDGRRLVGRRLGIYFPRDLALIQLPPGDYAAVSLAPAGSLSPGDWVLAYGHPGGLKPDHQPTFSAGQVTGKVDGVKVSGILDYTGGVETDLAIYSGNSGGPLFDLDGRLAGINGAVSPVEGESYSLSVDIIESVLPKLREARIYLSDDVVIDPADSLFSPFFEKYDAMSRQVAEQWVATGWPGETMTDPGSRLAGLERWGARIVKGIESARNRLEKIPIWKDRHGEARQKRLAAAFEPTAKGLGGRVFRLQDEAGREIALATVILQGLMVTKASLVESASEVFFGGPERSKATLVAVSEEHDLALYRFAPAAQIPGDAKLLEGQSTAPVVGSWVVVPAADGHAIAAGVLSAAARPIPSQADGLVSQAVQRGIVWGLIAVLRSAGRESPLSQLADQLEAFDEKTRVFELGHIPRTYPSVLQHDAPLDLDVVGGPLADAEGRILGINIARAHHGTTYAVPIEVVLGTFAEELQGK